ncbi:MAG: UDP-N-acetylglucosamine 2-epimerase (non-hydrolyzing) [Bacteroidales bacterium]|nr:UDP-N-acetylglucosamine 2-epimerase (non-hydrolyzing) [Bacteroidales bacterium]
MIKIVTVIGARPQIIKAAALSRAISTGFKDKINEIIVHTGQHYDANMSQVFIDELGIPAPDYNLGVGSGSHGRQTAVMIEGIEKILQDEKPDFLVLYGDTNSTLAGAVASSKLRIPIVHIEAGLRSFNKSMPEEINRIMCDHASTLLFSPTLTGYRNLLREGFSAQNQPPFTSDNPGIFHCGDIMFDNSLHFAGIAEERSDVLKQWGLEKENYLLATIHRDNNTDDPERLRSIFSALNQVSLANNLMIALPLHPRTSGLLRQNLPAELFTSVSGNPFITMMPPVSFLDMIKLEKHARMVITDSGGVQKEAYYFGKPCVIARPETEWVEIVEAGAGIIADADENAIVLAATGYLNNPPVSFPEVFGDGKAAEFICRTIAGAAWK